MKAWLARLDARLGLIGKVRLALAAAALLTLVVTATAWLSFQQVVATQRAIIDDAVPAMDAVQAVTRLNLRVGALVEQLGRAETGADVERLQQASREQLAEMRNLLQRLGRQHFEPALGTAAAATLDAIEANLARQADDMRQRITLGERERTLLAAHQRAVLTLVMLAESLAANASTATTATISGLYPLIGAGRARERIYDSLDRLIEVNFDRMERMAELQMVCFKLKTLLERLEREENADALAGLRDEFDGNLAVLHRRLQDIIDPNRKASGVAEYETLAGGVAVDGLFAVRGQRLERAVSFRRLRDEGGTLAAQLGEQAGALAASAGRAIDLAGEESRRAVERGIVGFLTVGAILFFALMATLWVLFRFHVLGRLKDMETAVRAVGSGDYDIPIPDVGNDPLTPLARALEQFRDNARERRRLECELLRHQQELEDQVAARTTELQQSNALLAREVSEHAAARREAEEANRAKNLFLGSLSHELRTPLSGVNGSVQLLRDTGLDARQQEYVRMIGYANATLLEILEDMLSFSRLEAGKFDHEHLPFALRDAIDDMLALQGVAARAKGIALVRDIAAEVPRVIIGDRRKLNQILLNVIGNAIKFTDEGSVTVAVRGGPAAPGERAALSFTVSDTGIGIPPEQCAEVFKPFVQVEGASHHRPGGTGLGLAICKRLVELMHGRIGLESVPGEGTQVSFELGFEVGESLPGQVRETLPATPQQPLDVLLVEDDEINRIVCVRYLESLGHHPLVAGDGDEALALLRRREAPLDVVLMDISLPGASGIEVARDIRALDGGRWASVPVVAMSAHLPGDAFDSIAGAGMAGFLGKPFDRAELARALAAATAGHGAVEAPPPPSADDAALDEAYLVGELESLGAATLVRLRDLFRAEADSALAEFDEHLVAGNHAAIAKRAHRLCGAAGNLGLRQVITMARQLESAANDPATAPDELRQHIATLHETCRAACQALAEWLHANEM
ncbi:response regulator [Aromatoleum toluvorans]|uniref:histidine kinase n=1 Tax=Aromatoleum toluvorans TaxID=92002 RepID=A0ABX1Q1J2_9RHOO|nr:ATP-binding protein [Aromatoleum toluvorans]NMG45573.1 response regulator [Aromatoleum toluvorans]